MSAGPIVLDYELTKEQFLTEWKKDVTRSRTTWRTKLVSAGVFLFTLQHLGKVPWWVSVLELAVAMSTLWMSRIVIWTVTMFVFWSKGTLPCHIEIDGQGLSFHWPGFRSAPSRFEWSNLTGVKETDFAIELQFKRRLYGAAIPWIAFRDAEQEEAFLQLIDEHLPEKAFESCEGGNGQ